MRSFSRDGLLLLCFAAASAAADYPDRPLRFVVPQAAGSATDNVAHLPRPVLDKLNAAVNAAIVEPRVKERLAQMGSEGGGGSPEDYAELIRRDSAKWAEVIRRSGARID